MTRLEQIKQSRKSFDGRVSNAQADWLIAEIEQLKVSNDALAKACAEFVRKVEVGEARSKRSYAEMKVALETVRHEP